MLDQEFIFHNFLSVLMVRMYFSQKQCVQSDKKLNVGWFGIPFCTVSLLLQWTEVAIHFFWHWPTWKWKKLKVNMIVCMFAEWITHTGLDQWIIWWLMNKKARHNQHMYVSATSYFAPVLHMASPCWRQAGKRSNLWDLWLLGRCIFLMRGTKVRSGQRAGQRALSLKIGPQCLAQVSQQNLPSEEA